jgi:hypothetical protein
LKIQKSALLAKRAQAIPFAPASEFRGSVGVRAPCVPIANIGGEEFDEALASRWIWCEQRR